MEADRNGGYNGGIPAKKLKATSRITRAEFNCLCEYAGRSTTPFILEVGTLRGGTAKLLAEKFPDRWVWTVDIAAYAPDELSQIPNLARVLADSTKFCSMLEKTGLCPSFALVFLDASHLYKGVKSDFQCWSRFVAEDGYIALHDARVIDGTAVTMDGTTWDGDREGPRRVVSEAIADGWHQVAVADSVVVLSKERSS